MGAVDGKLVLSSGEWWRLFTAPLLHANLSHLVGNAIALFFAGLILEPLIGGGWFGAVFGLSALAGSVGSILQNDPNLASVGASGGIMGLLAAAFMCSFLFDEPKKRRRMQFVSLRIMVPALLPALFPAAAMSGHVDYGAHVGGFAVGGTLGIIFNALLSERESMPFRGPAVMVAGALCAMAASAFFLVAQYRETHLAQGKDLIPEALLPKDMKAGANDAGDLLRRFPNDPRSHFYKAWSFIYSNDLGGADAELNIALESPLISGGDLPRQVAPSVKSTLALVLQAEGQSDSARNMAKEVCANSDLPSQIRVALEKQKLCD